jgi:8-oxo-dGTP pyrophosphatase MutT (NUDIX family)
VAGSRKKAAVSELDALKRHLRKGREITTWEPRFIDDRVLDLIAADIAKGVLIDTAVQRAGDLLEDLPTWEIVDETEKSDTQWPGWEHDLSLVATHKERVADAFHEADAKASQLRKDAATGKMMVSESTLKGLISDELEEIFTRTLNPLWTEAWNVGYAAAESLVSGSPADFSADHTGEALDGFLNTEGTHWLQQIARTGLGNSMSRSANIARTEVARAINTAALQCYKDHGVAYKHLMLAPDDTCDVCKGAEEDGIIPLDASFSAGGTLGFCHPQCRCVPAPADIDVNPPLSDIGKTEDNNHASFIMFRARNKENKWVYLLQKRGDDMNHPGTWGLPGGTAHVGESPWETAAREVGEEIGVFPLVDPSVVLTRHEKDRVVAVYLCELPSIFHPTMDGETMNESSGYGWFTEDEVDDLNLQPNFRKQWDDIDWHEIAKSGHKFLNVNENGEVAVQDDGGIAQPKPTGADWPHPHRAGIPVSGDVQGEPADDWSDGVNSLIYPVGDDDDDFPKDRGKPSHRNRNTPSGDDTWPGSQTSVQSPVTQTGGNTGVPPKGAHPARGGLASPRGDLSPGQGQSLSGGPVPAVTPHPYAPHAVPPVLMAPDGNECSVCGGPSDSPMHEIRPAK